jgi:hypothetical protein
MKRLVMIALAGTAACSDANVAGNYSAAITNKADGCSIGWVVGEKSMDVQFTVTQDGSSVTLAVNPLSLPGVFIGGLTGSNMFKGQVDGEEVSLSISGTRPNTSGGCTWMYNAQIDASQDGDTMSGSVKYRAATNDDPSCGTRTGCVSTQEFNAIRAPE